MSEIFQILSKSKLSKEELTAVLDATATDWEKIYRHATEIKEKYVGNKVYLRGLIELSNSCKKNCFYCGIRASNSEVERYAVSDDEVVEAAMFAHQQGFGSLVLQAGERSDKEYVNRIEKLLQKIMLQTNQELGITLSLGEQSESTYQRWKDAGAKRYLLRIETSNRELYRRLHPEDHSFDERISCLHILKKLNYQVGSGVMIGLPFQRSEHLAEDLLFLQSLDIDMIGMGPYIEHEETPLYEYRKQLLPIEQRFEYSLRMVALLRIMMKDINIAATTAMQTIDPQGREKAIRIGANVVMPNLTPLKYRENYHLYQGKTTVNDITESLTQLEKGLESVHASIAYKEHGDPLHFKNKTANNQ